MVIRSKNPRPPKEHKKPLPKSQTKTTTTIHYPRPKLEKYGKHFMDCYRQSKTWCRTKKKAGETISSCAEGLCHHHMHSGRCFIGGHLKQGSIDGSRRAKPTKAYLKRLEKREKRRK